MWPISLPMKVLTVSARRWCSFAGTIPRRSCFEFGCGIVATHLSKGSWPAPSLRSQTKWVLVSRNILDMWCSQVCHDDSHLSKRFPGLQIEGSLELQTLMKRYNFKSHKLQHMVKALLGLDLVNLIILLFHGHGRCHPGCSSLCACTVALLGDNQCVYTARVYSHYS